MIMNSFELKAHNFIDSAISKSRLSYDALMVHLELKQDDWSINKKQLDLINIFELTDDQLENKHYLEYLLSYSDKLIWKHKMNKLIANNKKNL